MHTLLEYDGKLLFYVNITKGSVADNKGSGKHSLEREQSLLQTDSFSNVSIWDSKVSSEI